MSESTSSPSGWRGLLADAHLALTFLTRLPLPANGPCVPGALARAMRLFPLAGAVVGLAGGGVFVLAHSAVPPLLAALLAVLATVLVTGALHEDGLADTADGLGARGGRENRLAAMRDSRSGVYGVLALVFSVAVRAAALAAVAALAWLARRRFGGFTGDILGASQHLAEIAIFVVLAGTWS